VIENPSAIPVRCAAGSLLCWHGNTWHGALNRKSDGIRVSIVVDLVRSHIRTGENLSKKISQEVLNRNAARFAVLTHQGMSQGRGDAKQASAGARRYMEVMTAYQNELGADLLSSTSSYS
jgi:ectoine hydroxylase-related dioxygenase (phytanoyl-CoA dioxygenase family)